MQRAPGADGERCARPIRNKSIDQRNQYFHLPPHMAPLRALALACVLRASAAFLLGPAAAVQRVARARGPSLPALSALRCQSQGRSKQDVARLSRRSAVASGAGVVLSGRVLLGDPQAAAAAGDGPLLRAASDGMGLIKPLFVAEASLQVRMCVRARECIEMPIRVHLAFKYQHAWAVEASLQLRTCVREQAPPPAARICLTGRACVRACVLAMLSHSRFAL